MALCVSVILLGSDYPKSVAILESIVKVINAVRVLDYIVIADPRLM